MTLIVVTQRMVLDTKTGEWRDCLDQAWHAFLEACDLVPLIMPNHLASAKRLLEVNRPEGVLLTGGGDIAAQGGRDVARDEVEAHLLDWAETEEIPVFGVCRGMQVLLDRFGTSLKRVTGHVRTRHTVAFDTGGREVNSFHDFGAISVEPPLIPWARSPEDGTIEAVRHESRPIAAIMWHPERERPFDEADIALVRSWLHPQGIAP